MAQKIPLLREQNHLQSNSCKGREQKTDSLAHREVAEDWEEIFGRRETKDQGQKKGSWAEDTARW